MIAGVKVGIFFGKVACDTVIINHRQRSVMCEVDGEYMI